MILRRTFDLPALAGDTNRPQVIVTFDDFSGELFVGHRHNPWEEWSRPLDVLTVDDDEALPGNRGYGPGGRAYPPDSTVEIGGQVMTQAQYDAARHPLLMPYPGEPYSHKDMPPVPPGELDAPGPDAKLGDQDRSP